MAMCGGFSCEIILRDATRVPAVQQSDRGDQLAAAGEQPVPGFAWHVPHLRLNTLGTPASVAVTATANVPKSGSGSRLALPPWSGPLDAGGLAR